MATAPTWSSYWPKGVTASSFDFFGKKAADAASYPNIAVDTPSNYQAFVNNAKIPGTTSAQLADLFGGPEKYKAAADAYRLAYFNWQNETRPDVLSNQIALEQEKANQKASAVYSEEQGLPVAKPSAQIEREDRYNSVRSQLENQYNNLQRADSRFGYAGRNADLPAVFNQQAAQLADAGVTDISNLRIQSGRLVDISTGKTVNTSNLGGQVYTDRDTGVQKWGDIFSGVKGGANYGIIEAQDGSVLLFPAWEKTKSPIAQVGLGGLESVITPLLTVGGALVGVPGLGAVGGAAAGAAAGSTAGQLLASGEIDWERVALSAAGAGAGEYIGGLLGGEEVVAATSPDLSGTTGGMTGADYGFQVSSPGAGISGGGLTSAEMAALKTGAGYGETAQSLLNADLDFISADAAQLWKQTGDVAAVQQNLIAAGVDPIMAAEASNLAALGGTAQSISSALGQAFPGETVFTSEGLLSGGSTMDDFAKDIGGNITSSATPALSVSDALNYASKVGNLLGGPQQQGLLGGGQQAGGRQPGGVDYSGLLALLQGRAGVPGVAPLIGPVSQSQTSLLDMQSQPTRYQSLTGMINPSLLG